ncbi:MAG TPA: hypothetical protein VFA18_18505, partial [Gemmataceae bacterium]|nr:hypothetical protein [Gemmataceae bacterium]
RYLVHRPHSTSLCTVQETATGQDLVAVVGSHSAGARPVVFSDNGHTLATATTGFLFGRRESYVSTWNVTTGEEGAHIAVPDASDTACAVSPDGRKIAVTERARRSAAGAIRIWDTSRGVQLRQIPTPATNIGGLVYSPDGRLLATSNYQKIQLWDATSGQAGVTLEDPPARPHAAMAFSPDGRALAVACADEGKIIIWELASGGVRRVLEGHHATAYALAFSRDGRLLASGGADTAIFLWDRFGDTGTRGQPSSALTPAELQSCWTDLADRHARVGYQTMCRLLTVPQQTLALLDRQLQADTGKVPGATEISGWIMALDDKSFHKRAQAYRELAEAGVTAQPALTRALAEKPSLEKRRRLEALLSELKSARPAPARIRLARALELLEHLGSPPARHVLQRLANGQADAWLTRAAKAALGRLAIRSK